MQTHPQLTVGVDLGDRKSSFCVLDTAGDVIRGETISTTPAAFERFFASLSVARVIMAAGTQGAFS